MVKASRHQFIANLPVKLLMQWFGRCAIQPDHFKSEYRMSTALLLKMWRRMFGVRRSAFSSAHQQEHEHEHESEQLSIESGLAISVQVDC